jgi:putative flippase GtrA
MSEKEEEAHQEIQAKHSTLGAGYAAFRRLFFDKKFVTYTGVGIFISAFNVGLLWILIDVMHIRTVTAGVIATITIFVMRYLLLALFKVV